MKFIDTLNSFFNPLVETEEDRASDRRINQLCRELEQSITQREYKQSIDTVINIQATTVQPKPIQAGE